MRLRLRAKISSGSNHGGDMVLLPPVFLPWLKRYGSVVNVVPAAGGAADRGDGAQRAGLAGQIKSLVGFQMNPAGRHQSNPHFRQGFGDGRPYHGGA